MKKMMALFLMVCVTMVMVGCTGDQGSTKPGTTKGPSPTTPAKTNTK